MRFIVILHTLEPGVKQPPIEDYHKPFEIILCLPSGPEKKTKKDLRQMTLITFRSVIGVARSQINILIAFVCRLCFKHRFELLFISSHFSLVAANAQPQFIVLVGNLSLEMEKETRERNVQPIFAVNIQ